MSVKYIDTKIDEIVNTECLISEILNNENFNSLNNLKKEPLKTIELISINKDYNINEKEFYVITDTGKRGVHKNTGNYQEKLYGNYKKAVEERDIGYIKDVLKKAIVFRNNVEEVKKLMKNKNFMKQWRKDVGRISPLKILKNTGKMKEINIIKRLTIK